MRYASPVRWEGQSLLCPYPYRPSKEPSRRVRYDRAQLIPEVFLVARITPYPTGRLFWGGAVPGTSCQATIAPSLRDKSVRSPAGIRPYPTGRLSWDDAFPGTSCQATIVLSLRDALSDISQQALV